MGIEAYLTYVHTCIYVCMGLVLAKVQTTDNISNCNLIEFFYSNSQVWDVNFTYTYLCTLYFSHLVGFHQVRL